MPIKMNSKYWCIRLVLSTFIWCIIKIPNKLPFQKLLIFSSFFFILFFFFSSFWDSWWDFKGGFLCSFCFSILLLLTSCPIYDKLLQLLYKCSSSIETFCAVTLYIGEGHVLQFTILSSWKTVMGEIYEHWALEVS